MPELKWAALLKEPDGRAHHPELHCAATMRSTSTCDDSAALRDSSAAPGAATAVRVTEC